MRLKPQVAYVEFLKTVWSCAGEVYYQTRGGDCLNLKSLLSEYVFLSAAASHLLEEGVIHCVDSCDYGLLMDYLEADE